MSAAQPPILHLIAGCNGAGKTTFAREFLPREARCLNFLNADLIAQGISPLNNEAGAIRAARLLLAEVRALVRRKETFALESTLSGRTYLRRLREAKRQGYRIHLHYLWLPTVALAIARVRERVKKGGHNVPVADIRRRFHRSQRHFIEDYAPLVDFWAVWDNRGHPPVPLVNSETCPLSELPAMLGLI
ncbi:MAG: zeta toxin family protein [Verrucomicrobia bacterium]|nr:zeta toxin family protein [Verrucomicrobiota bacterium]